MKNFCVKYHRQLLILSLVLAVYPMAVLLAGCGVPTWLSDANQIVGLVGTSIATIGAFIAGLTGNTALSAALAVVSAWVTKVTTGISDLEALISQYNESPSPTLLSDIKAALADVKANVQQDFSNLGLPASILSVIAGVAELALSQLEAWGSLIPALTAKAKDVVTIHVPYTSKEFKALVNAVLEKPTGDPQVDAALAKVKKL
jgi:hypothetical protein